MATSVTGINIEQVVDISTSVEASLDRVVFGTGLMLTQDNLLDGGGEGKVKRFIDAASVSAFFGEDSDVTKDAAVWFGADPRPEALYIGRWAKDTVGSIIESGTVTKAASAFTSGNLKFGSTTIAITLSSPASYSAIATALQNAISAQITGTTVRYANNKFIISFAGAGNPNLGVADTNDLSGAANLNLATTNEGAGGRLRLGSVSESISECIAACEALSTDGTPVALMLARDVDSDDGQSPATSVKTLMRRYAQGGDYVFATIEASDTVLNQTDTTSEMYKAKDEGSTKTAVIFSDDTTKRSDIAVLAKLSGMDFNQPESLETLVPKALPSVSTSVITEADLQVVLGKNGSVLTRVDGEPTFLGGRTGGGTWIDSQWWITWLKTEMERSIFNALRNSKRLNNAQLSDVIASVMSKAVRSGGVQLGGVVSEGIKNEIRRTTGNRDFNGKLSAGYVLWMDSPANQTTVDRAARVSRFKIWIAPSQAIQSVEGVIILASG